MSPFSLLIAYISLLHLGPILNLMNWLPGGRVFPITTVGHVIAVFLALRHFTEHQKQGDRLTKLDLAVMAYLLWSLGSVVLFFQSGNPCNVNAYWYGLHICAAPIAGYFAMKTISSEEQNRLMSFVLWTNVAMVALGVYLWWARPDFYTAYLREIIFNGADDRADWQVYSRLQSYLGSTAVGVICALSIALTRVLQLGIIPTLLVISLCLPSAIITSQRGGIGAAIMALGYVLVAPARNRIANVIIGVGAIAIGSAFLIFVTERSEGGLDYYLQRKDEFNNLLEGRSYGLGMQYITSFPMGVGLGGSLGASASAGLTEWGKVVDANFMRIAADLGVQGLLLLAVVIGFAIHACWRRRRSLGLMCVIGVYVGIAVGTNVFDGHLSPQLFWLFLGMADTPETSHETQAAQVPDSPASDAENLGLLQPAPHHRAGA